MTTLSVLDQLESGARLVTRHRVLLGEDGNTERRGDKVVIARSDCTFRCADYPTLRKCVDAIQESDERLLARPDQLMLWDWKDTWVQFDNPDNPPAGGGTVYLGVAWYDPDFFDERKTAGTGIMHQHIYDRIGLGLEDITIEHFLGADVARWSTS